MLDLDKSKEASLPHETKHSSYFNMAMGVRRKEGRLKPRDEPAEKDYSAISNYVYTYDSIGRLLTVIKNGTLVEEYEYSPNGNRTYEMNILKGIPGRTFAYSDEDHLVTAGTVTYLYDYDGFLGRKTDGSDITEYEYSSRGELLNVSLPDGSLIEYVHDPLGRRIAKKVDNVTVEKYLWQGLTRLLAVYDGSNNLLMRFEYADGRMPVAMTMGGATTYYLTCDQVGSLRVVVDASGNIVNRIDYDSFGNVIEDTNPSFQIPFGFAGGLHDRDTGLVRFGYRDYAPEIGRWIAKDPIGFAGGDTDLYGYCLGDPVDWVDTWGLWDSPAPGHLLDPGPGGRAPYPLAPVGDIPRVTVSIEPGAWDFILYGAAIGSSHIQYLAIAPACGLAGAIPGSIGMSGIVLGYGIMLQGFSMIDISFDCPEDPCE
ncbi:MAG: RHS repeat-associated core domain-containing protein [Bacteroidota bacterium]|nr:RHS repeat-associated core domain-containing protein [Bacteroidota bacterium]